MNPRLSVVRIKEKMRAQELALGLASRELHRRLDALNGEAERLRSMQATYVPRETYEMRHSQLGDKVNSLEQFKANLEGRMWIGGAVILILAACMALLSRLIK